MRWTWKPKTYATRYDGMLNEQQMFARNEALEAEARTLWTAGGGTGDGPLDGRPGAARPAATWSAPDDRGQPWAWR